MIKLASHVLTRCDFADLSVTQCSSLSKLNIPGLGTHKRRVIFRWEFCRIRWPTPNSLMKISILVFAGWRKTSTEQFLAYSEKGPPILVQNINTLVITAIIQRENNITVMRGGYSKKSKRKACTTAYFLHVSNLALQKKMRTKAMILKTRASV